jgi:hypothetical protein
MPYMGVGGLDRPYLGCGRGWVGTLAGAVGPGATLEVVVGAALAVGSVEATAVAVCAGAVAEAAESAVAPVLGSVGTSGVGGFSALHDATATDAATMTARPAVRRAQKGHEAAAGMCLRQRAHGRRSRIGTRDYTRLAEKAISRA